MNKILFNKKMVLYSNHYKNVSEVYLVPFTLSAEYQHFHLHEPNINLTGIELTAKVDIQNRIRDVLSKMNMVLLNISFTSNTLTIGIE